MQVKLLAPGLIGLVNREAGEVIDVDESLARDIAERGDGLIVVDPEAQVIPPSGGTPLPTTSLSDVEDVGKPPAQPSTGKADAQGAKAQKLASGDAK